MEVWRGRRVLVTGTTGFKGAWLAELLLGRGAEVVGIGLPPEQSDALSVLLGLSGRIEERLIDLRDQDALTNAVAQASPEVVIHLAAQALVRRGHADPIGTWHTNVLGTVHLLEAVRATPGVRAVLVATTDKVYAGDHAAPHRETDRLGGRCPYSASKVAAEQAVLDARHRWARGRGLGLATARAGNTLGGGDLADDRLVPDCVRAVRGGSALSLRSPQAVRPWLHVLDVLDGYLRLADALVASPGSWETINLGPTGGDDLTVEAVARAVLAALGQPQALVVAPSDGPAERQVLRLDAGRAAELRWAPRLSTADALRWTADWYAAWLGGADPLSLCRQQIAEWDALQA